MKGENRVLNTVNLRENSTYVRCATNFDKPARGDVGSENPKKHVGSKYHKPLLYYLTNRSKHRHVERAKAHAFLGDLSEVIDISSNITRTHTPQRNSQSIDNNTNRIFEITA